MARDYFTTSQAAKLLSVSPDTVLRWVKSDKIASYRTPGGHSRIPKEAVLALLNNSEPEDTTSAANLAYDNLPFLFCWEHHENGEVSGGACTYCPVFRARRERCYRMRCDCQDFESLNLLCQSSCDECEYFVATSQQPLGFLVVSPSSELRQKLSSNVESGNMRVCVTDGAYTCSQLIEKFRPDYIIVDCAFGTERTRTICRHLLDDPRLPIPRIMLASPQAKLEDHCDREVFGWIKKPFTVSSLEALVEGIGSGNRSSPE